MSTDALSPASPPAKRWWKDPFVVAFFVGAAFLSALPFVQVQMLRAPAPLAPLPAWSLVALDGGAVEHTALLGKPWIVSFIPAGCDAACRERLQTFGGAAAHLEDVAGRIALVSLVAPGAEAVARELAAGRPDWRFLTGAAEQLAPLAAAFDAGWLAQGGLTDKPWLERPTFAVVDQAGAVRGFWTGDTEGRGHAINAARMFARHGVEP